MRVARLKDYPFLGSLMLMLTRACQFSCVYCRYDKSRPPMSREIIRRSIDLLFRSEADPVRLQLFGGEPLLRSDLMREAVSYALELSARRRRGLRLTLTTNGLLLNEQVFESLASCPADYLVSFDGGRETQASQRPIASPCRSYPYEPILAGIRMLIRRGADFFVNMVTSPDNASRAGANARFLAGLGVRRLRFSYQLGVPWTGAQAAAYFGSIFAALRETPGLEAINPLCLDEPDIMTPTPNIDCDGTIYVGSVVPALERRLARLVPLTRVGSVWETRRMDDLKRDRRGLWNALRDAYPAGSPEGRAVDSSLRMGLLSDAFFDRLALGRPVELEALEA